jgi:predicted nucleic acid-binding protein
VDAVLRGTFPFLLSFDLLAEYRTVLFRPKIQRLHGLTTTEVDTILTKMTTNGLVKEPGGTQAKGLDPCDLHIWQLLETVSNAMLVTGDQALRKFLIKTTPVFSPQEFNFENLEQD